MKILLVTPPNCGRSIPEERYGVTSLRPIFQGEPLGLEVLAGNLEGHEVVILDLKVEGEGGLRPALNDMRPDLVGITAMTCEANTALDIAQTVKDECGATVVIGGIHASCAPEYFNRSQVDYIITGLGKKSFREVVDAIQAKSQTSIDGVAKTDPGNKLSFTRRKFSADDMVEAVPPRYDLVERYRSSYTVTAANIPIGFVVNAVGCPHRCEFCCIEAQAGGKYLSHSAQTVLRDINLLEKVPLIRLVDANSFADTAQAFALCSAVREGGVAKQFIADARSDTVVNNPELFAEWKKAGLRALVMGFEEINDARLEQMNKKNSAVTNAEAMKILHDLGISVVGDFIISPDYTEEDFGTLESYIEDHEIAMPVLTVMTPLPGTRLFERLKGDIVEPNLDYYTLTNAVVPTAMDEERFYRAYAGLTTRLHKSASI